MNILETKKQIKENVVCERVIEKRGGQQTNGPRYHPVVLKSEELELEIKLCYHRNFQQNKDLAMTVFELILDELDISRQS